MVITNIELRQWMIKKYKKQHFFYTKATLKKINTVGPQKKKVKRYKSLTAKLICHLRNLEVQYFFMQHVDNSKKINLQLKNCKSFLKQINLQLKKVQSYKSVISQFDIYEVWDYNIFYTTSLWKLNQFATQKV